MIKPINIYKKNVEGKNFCDFIKDIIPNEEIYDSIIHYDKKPIIKNNKLYNDMCEKNETIYINKSDNNNVVVDINGINV